MFLVKVLLELRKLAEVPVFLTKSVPGVTKLSWRRSAPASATTAPKTGWSAPIPGRERERGSVYWHLLQSKASTNPTDQSGCIFKKTNDMAVLLYNLHLLMAANIELYILYIYIYIYIYIIYIVGSATIIHLTWLPPSLQHRFHHIKVWIVKTC